MQAAQIHPYVYYATEFPFSKGQTSSPRICYSSSLYLISHGAGVLHTCGRTYATVPGSIVFIPAGQPHEWIADTTNPMVHVCCYFDWFFVDRSSIFKTPSTICYNFDQLQPALVGPAFPYPIPEYLKIESIRIWNDLLEKCYTPNEFASERTFIRGLKKQSHFQMFIEHFLVHALQNDQLPDPRIAKLIEIIEQDLVRGILRPLESYYSTLRISRGYFFDLFKKSTGIAPLQYIQHFRISRAKDDLRSSNLSISIISEKHHFASVHYFSRLFHQVTGQTPSAFRKSQS